MGDAAALGSATADAAWAEEPTYDVRAHAPTLTGPPAKIAGDTDVIQQVQPALGQPLFVYINLMVIRGEEPVIVTPARRRTAGIGWTMPFFWSSPTTSGGCPATGVRLADDSGVVRPEDGRLVGVDSFATPLPDPHVPVAELDPESGGSG